MPPKKGKRGRPKGSTNKKLLAKRKLKRIKIKFEDDPYKGVCDACNREFDNKHSFIKHRIRCNQNSLQNLQQVTEVVKVALSCKECNKKFKFKESLNSHYQNAHSKLRDAISCSQCNVRCPTHEILEQHIQNVHEKKEFKCEYCNKTFVRHSHVMRHMSQTGCDGHGHSVYKCEICDAEFSRKDNLQVHLRLQHILRQNYNCKLCTYSSKNFSKLIRHWQKVHLDPPIYTCEHCGKTTSSRAAITKHLEIHGEKSHSCDACGYSTFTAEVLRRHILTHVTEKPYKCHLCSFSYIQRSQLRRHLEKHEGNACLQCKKTFPSKLKLLVHLREHKGLDKLVCTFDDCSLGKRVFTDERSLHAHLKSHIESRPYSCEVCSKSFHTEVTMRRHVGTHRLDRPRRCMYCVTARAYIRGEQLLRHVRKLHPDIFRQHLHHVRRVLELEGNNMEMKPTRTTVPTPSTSNNGEEQSVENSNSPQFTSPLSKGVNPSIERVKKSELESILNVLDAESERIIENYSDKDVLYGGVHSQDDDDDAALKQESPLMSEEDLVENLKTLLGHLIDKETLEYFGWPDETVDEVLEKVIESCCARAADKQKWTRVQCLRENTKHLFLYAIEDKNIARMLDTHTIDQIVKHINAQVADENKESK